MEKITLQKGDYVLAESLSEEMYHRIAEAFIEAGCRKGGEYPDLGGYKCLKYFGWDNEGRLYHSEVTDTPAFRGGRCLTPEQILGTTTSKWTGKDLPPVGEVCEFSRNGKWQECEIIGHFEQPLAKVAAFTLDNGAGVKTLRYATEQSFRPIKTDEEKAVDSIAHIMATNFNKYSYWDTAKEIYAFLQKETLT